MTNRTVIQRLLVIFFFFMGLGLAQGTNLENIVRGLKNQQYDPNPTNVEISVKAPNSGRDQLDQEHQLVREQLEVITGDEETRYVLVQGDYLRISFNE